MVFTSNRSQDQLIHNAVSHVRSILHLMLSVFSNASMNRNLVQIDRSRKPHFVLMIHRCSELNSVSRINNELVDDHFLPSLRTCFCASVRFYPRDQGDEWEDTKFSVSHSIAPRLRKEISTGLPPVVRGRKTRLSSLDRSTGSEQSL